VPVNHASPRVASVEEVTEVLYLEELTIKHNGSFSWN
jgi:hypothetical protein